MYGAISPHHDDIDVRVDGYIADRAGSRGRSGVQTSSRRGCSWRAFLLPNRDALSNSSRLYLYGAGTVVGPGFTCRTASPRIGRGCSLYWSDFGRQRRLTFTFLATGDSISC